MGRVCALLALAACSTANYGGRPCNFDGECPLHQACTAGACVTGCLRDGECAYGQRCDDHGACVSILETDAAPPADAALAPDLAAPLLTVSCGDTSGASGFFVDAASGHCYVAWPGPVAFADAERSCQAHGAQLAAIGSSAEQQIVVGLAGASARWIGLVSAAGKDNFVRWRSGELVGFSAWAAGQPIPAQQRDCVQLDASGWTNRDCGWPSTGNLPPGQMSTAGFVCESACGNGIVDPGESCDPPGASCTQSCRRIAPCGDPGGISSPVDGHCYFPLAATSDWPSAACPAGTHLAIVDGIAANEAAMQAVAAQSWIDLRADTGVSFYWADGSDFNPRRYHGFISSEPNAPQPPACVRIIPGQGWADHACATQYARLCQRD
jgi:hypothetical protein